MIAKTSLIVLFAAASCTTSPDIHYIEGFDPPPVEADYTRFVTPTVLALQPGADLLYCQWIEAPKNTDRQIVSTLGYQSRGGHHVALYATSAAKPVGTSHLCTVDDMLTVSFVGAIGAEGAEAAKLPPGMAFDLPAGMALMANTHYLNETDDVLDGQSVVDLKFSDPDHPLPAAGSVAVNWDGFTIPVQAAMYTSDSYCPATAKSSYFMWANHMHQWGAQAMSEIIHPDGSRQLMAMDDPWNTEETFNPSWTRWNVDTPMVVNPGDIYHVQCSWNNTTPDPIMFPLEMCVAIGFTLEATPQSICSATATM